MFSINFIFFSLSQPTTPPNPQKNPTQQQVTCVPMVKASLLITQGRHHFFYRVRRDKLKAAPDPGLDITYTCYLSYWNPSAGPIQFLTSNATPVAMPFQQYSHSTRTFLKTYEARINREQFSSSKLIASF